jgi:hypothetical protein
LVCVLRLFTQSQSTHALVLVCTQELTHSRTHALTP